jgi:Mor family transcriptional regulator
MNASERAKRNEAILRDIRDGKDARAVAKRYRLTKTRVQQIVNSTNIRRKPRGKL